MGYSERDLEALCEALANHAEPVEAAALRQMAENYRSVPQRPKRKFGLRQGIAAVVVVYALWTVIYFTYPPFVPSPKPTAAMVEQLVGFKKTDTGWTARTYKFAPRETFVRGKRIFDFTEAAPPVVYENNRPMPDHSYDVDPLSPNTDWRFVTIKTTDDPNTSGKRYYLVSSDADHRDR